jgi:hypothetical protein
MIALIKKFGSAIALLTMAGCATVSYDNAAGQPTVYTATNTTGPIAGVGIESQDIVGMTDQMMRSMLANPTLAGRSTPPRVIIDGSYFVNESSSIVDKNMITDRLRISLNQASNGRMVFVGRHYADMVEKERNLKRSGVVDGGTIRTTQATAGADYKLGGRISSQDSMQKGSQMKSRYSMIIFEMVDLELGTIVWSGMYEFKKTAQDNIMYR